MTCSYKDCTRAVAWKGLCNGHYLRQQRGTDMDKPFKDPRSGLRSHPLYSRWSAMKDRCDNPNNPNWINYGGRGITYCESWKDFKHFLLDMESSYREGLSLNRIDNAKGYSPENCNWATEKAQKRNTRRNVFTQELANTIRQEHARGTSRQTLASEYGINQHAIDSVLYKDRWR